MATTIEDATPDLRPAALAAGVATVAHARRSERARAVAVAITVAAVGFGVFCVSLSVGDFPVPVVDVVPAVFGYGDASTHFIVHTLRLPRALTGLLVGASFGFSGAVFQALTRNPLASPDIIGINAGAAAGAVLVIVVIAGSATAVATGALVGGLATAAAIYALAYKRGLSSYRLVLVGIGIGAALTAVTEYLLTRAEIHDAQRAAVWLTGSLNGRGWDHVRPLTVVAVVLFPAVVILGRRLRVLQLGDDTATGLGLTVERSRGALVLVAVILAAVATASAGPIVFVAFMAPAIARRLTRAPGLSLIPSALCGAVLVIAADLVGRRILAPRELPVGIITGVIGGPYLLWLLARANKVGAGG
jgi:iron complex transport system permease protein